MPEITHERLMLLLGSAKKNRQEAYEMIYRYDGAIQTLTMLLDDLRVQKIKEEAEAKGSVDVSFPDIPAEGSDFSSEPKEGEEWQVQ